MTASRINEARDFLNSLIESPIKLPFEPTLLPELLASMSDNSRSSIKDVAALVGRSQGLAAKVLSVANSAYYRLLSPASTLERAVQVVGILDLRSLAVMFSVSESIPQKNLPKGFPTQGLWTHQIRVAKLGRSIAYAIAQHDPQTPNLPEPESVYAAGLLHDLGKIILASRRPDHWHNIIGINSNKGLSVAEAEEEYWGMDHGTIGGIVMQDWSLPPLLTDMISWHHYPQFAENNKLAVRILAAANILSECVLTKGGIMPLEVLQALPEYSAMLLDMYNEFADVIGDWRTEMFANLI